MAAGTEKPIDGVGANARLTGGAGALLLLLLAAEGATIPFIGKLIGPHIFIGVLLLPPLLLKLGSTGYRFARYYAGSPPYRRQGPPPPGMRLLAPGVVATSLALFGTGLALLLEGPGSAGLVALHKAAFVGWFALMTLHVLGHLLEVPRLASADWRRRGGRDAELAGAGLRVALLLTSALAGLGLAIATVSLAGRWLEVPLGG